MAGMILLAGNPFTNITSRNECEQFTAARVGLFALAVIIFFGQRYALGFVSMIASLFTPTESGIYGVILQSYNSIYALCIMLIIAGMEIFYKGQKESNLTSSTTKES